jgi:alanine racemase
MERLRPVIAPTIGIITNIGEAHQENFISLQQKCMEKLRLFVNSEAIIYNSDNVLISNCLEASVLSHRGIGWSRTNSEAMLYIESIDKRDKETLINCIIMGRQQLSYTVPFTDDASIENAIHCIALILYLKPTAIADTARFARLEPVDMRLNVRDGVNNCIIIDDAYNSDFNSLEIALNFLLNRQAGKDLKPTLILSDILQSGALPKSLYKRVAELVKRKKIRRLIGIGKDISECAGLFDIPEKEFYTDSNEFLASASLKSFRDEIILLKGSRKFHFERICEQLEKKTHETILEVNLDAIAHNFNYYRSLLQPSTKMTVMVKAYGYGAGAAELAKTLQEQRCDYLAVAVADEGAALRRDGVSIPIIVMNPEFSNAHLLFDNQLEPEVYSFRLLDTMIRETGRRGITSYPIHIKIDTGMNRLGFSTDDMDEICRRLQTQAGLRVESVFSHLVGSDSAEFDDFTHAQAAAFRDAAERLEHGLGHSVMKHILNSAGIERFPEYQFDMVRLGIGLYGVGYKQNRALENVSSLYTTILQIRNVKAGNSIGYSRRSYVSRDSRIGVLPIGYADGVNRRLGNGRGKAIVNGSICPFVGNICMDTTMIDLTDAKAEEGDRVMLFGNELTVREIADSLGTIPYEILTSVSPRVKRIYYRY